MSAGPGGKHSELRRATTPNAGRKTKTKPSTKTKSKALHFPSSIFSSHHKAPPNAAPNAQKLDLDSLPHEIGHSYPPPPILLFLLFTLFSDARRRKKVVFRTLDCGGPLLCLGMSSGILLALLTPQAALGSAVREQCWPQGSVSTNAPQNAAAISVLRSWGAAFDALQGQDVCADY